MKAETETRLEALKRNEKHKSDLIIATQEDPKAVVKLLLD